MHYGQDVLMQVDELLKTGKCDVNRGGSYDIETLPLFDSLKNIKTKDDEFYQISKLLLDHKDIDVNIRGRYGKTILEELCKTKCSTRLGVELLLSHKNIDEK